MNNELITTFLAIVKYRQISQAANSLYLSQAAVSNRLSKLESKLGVKLVNRVKGHSSLTLTEYGEKFIPIAEEYIHIINTANSLRNLVKFDTLTIATSADIAIYYVTPFLKDLLKSNPNLRINLITLPENELISAVQNGKCDVCLCFTPCSQGTMTSQKIYEDHFIAALSKDTRIVTNSVSIDSLERSYELHIPYNENYNMWYQICWDTEIVPLITSNTICSAIPLLKTLTNTWLIIPQKVLNTVTDIQPVKLIEQPPSLPIIAIFSSQSSNKDSIKKVLSLLSFLLNKPKQLITK